MATQPTVFVVDDDKAMRKSFRWLLESANLRVETYASAPEFLAGYDPARPGCLVLEVHMPGMSGLELQERLAAQQISIPVIVMTSHADVPSAVCALKAHALDFLEKPFSDQVLLACIHRAIERDAEDRRQRDRRAELTARLAVLTPREREVLHLLVAGKANKQIAAQIHISAKTVESHRAHVMQKMHANSIADLVRIAIEAEASPGNPGARIE